MNSREIVRRLHAWRAGRPLPLGETRATHLADDADALVLVFVKMGGESRPWGVALGRPGEPPQTHTVPEARDRDQVAHMMATVAPTMLGHLRTPGFTPRPPSEAGELAPLRQLWLPNATHLEMLHHLAYAYTFTEWGEDRRARLNALGRASGWLFREAQRPGQQHVMVATQVLREAYTFPAEDIRQGHLGFLLAWLDATGDRDQRLGAALAAEGRSMATALDPPIERDQLEPLVKGWQDANRADNEPDRKLAADEIDEVLRAELTHRFELTCRAIDRLRHDPRRENAGVAAFVATALDEQWWQHGRPELGFSGIDPEVSPFAPSVETDREPRAAAARYFGHVASAERVESTLIHDDAERLAEAVAEGRALTGRIVGVADEGPGSRTVPVWRLHQHIDVPLRLRPGNRVCQVGLPNREATIRALAPADAGGWIAELEITRLKTAPAGQHGRLAWWPTDDRWIGQDVAFVEAPADGLTRRKGQQIWNDEGPGAWLTHAPPANSGERRDPVGHGETAGPAKPAEPFARPVELP